MVREDAQAGDHLLDREKDAGGLLRPPQNAWASSPRSVVTTSSKRA
jgi:hypothetical protein